MNTALIASLSTAIADYESAWRTYLDERDAELLVKPFVAMEAATNALCESVGMRDAQAIRGALIMAAARVRGTRPETHTKHLDDVESFINDCIGGNA